MDTYIKASFGEAETEATLNTACLHVTEFLKSTSEALEKQIPTIVKSILVGEGKISPKTQLYFEKEIASYLKTIRQNVDQRLNVTNAWPLVTQYKEISSDKLHSELCINKGSNFVSAHECLFELLRPMAKMLHERGVKTTGKDGRRYAALFERFKWSDKMTVSYQGYLDCEQKLARLQKTDSSVVNERVSPRSLDSISKTDIAVACFLAVAIGCALIPKIGILGFIIFALTVGAFGAICYFIYKFLWQAISLAVLVFVAMGVIGLLLFGIRFLF